MARNNALKNIISTHKNQMCPQNTASSLHEKLNAYIIKQKFHKYKLHLINTNIYKLNIVCFIFENPKKKQNIPFTNHIQ